jgi:hypothetical protein
MKFLLTALSLLGVASAAAAGLYPAPCGRSIQKGTCSYEESCLKRDSTFWVGRDCEFYKGSDRVGCCYEIPS